MTGRASDWALSIWFIVYPRDMLGEKQLFSVLSLPQGNRKTVNVFSAVIPQPADVGFHSTKNRFDLHGRQHTLREAANKQLTHFIQKTSLVLVASVTEHSLPRPRTPFSLHNFFPHVTFFHTFALMCCTFGEVCLKAAVLVAFLLICIAGRYVKEAISYPRSGTESYRTLHCEPHEGNPFRAMLLTFNLEVQRMYCGR